MPSLDLPDSVMANNSANSSKHSTYQPYIIEYSIRAEYRLLCEQRLPGVYVVPSSNSHLVWFGVLFIRGGCYEGGVFKFTLFIPENYPDCECPRIVFDVPIFHPLVDPVSGELDCRRGFQKWRRNVHHLWQLILYARRQFYKVESKPGCPNNPEAAVLFEENNELFLSRVRECVDALKTKVYDKPKIEDDHAIRFTDLDEATLREAKEKMIRPQRATPDSTRKGAPLNGLSWMAPGSSQMFSRADPE